jgi:hypothetical protein
MNLVVSHKYSLALIVIGLVWLAFFDYATQMRLQDIIYPDSNSYRSAAENLYIHHRGDQYRPLVVSAIYGIPYLFGLGDSAVYEMAFWLNIVFWLGSILMLFKILTRFCTDGRAFGLTLIFVFSVGNTAYVFHLLTETLFVLMMLGAFDLLLRYRRGGNPALLTWALSILVLSILVRPGVQFFVGFVLLVFVRDLWILRRQPTMKVFYGSLAILLVQCIGLWYQCGNFTVSYIDAPTYYNYLGSRVEESKGNPPRDLGYIYSLEMPDQKRLAKADMMRHLTRDTDYFFRAYESNLRENAVTGNTAIADCKNLAKRSWFMGDGFLTVSSIQNRIFSILGLLTASVLLMFRRRFEPACGLVAIFVLYTILLSGISNSQGDRFTLVTYPFTIMMIARLLIRPKRCAEPLQTA